MKEAKLHHIKKVKRELVDKGYLNAEIFKLFKKTLIRTC
jgi:polyhydroxyalkanoate synthesis regulator phasin